MLDVLRLEPLLFPAEFTSHRMRILVNGVDVVAAAYPPGGFHGNPVAGFTPSCLLGPGGLAVAPVAREVGLGGSDTTEDELAVRIRQVGSEVIWDCWCLTDIGTVLKEGPEVGLETFRFDAQAYAAEMARATARSSRVWPARSVAEALQAVLWREGYAQDGGAWIRSYVAIRAPEERPDVVEISYYARDLSELRHAMPGRYVVTFPVDGTDPNAQARDIVHRLGHEDLKPLSAHQPRQRHR
ncbi:hypothetical protein EV384_6483 [Micromonospora kangleipakensis]|uniref:Uncharacterized protein n=1 Tax=Micromonospora kangleipakensis TaxID=1077942 RepID=A0A4Q8BI64_9ACTN|nr:hypothetical protein [Micromonospora kangleipakensis]RZU77742.1 hypothetical protein EV384_6483 [Micromonospora kangleipakensis]